MAKLSPLRISIRAMLSTARDDMDAAGDVYAPEVVEAMVARLGEYFYVEFGDPVTKLDPDTMRLSCNFTIGVSYIPPEKDRDDQPDVGFVDDFGDEVVSP